MFYNREQSKRFIFSIMFYNRELAKRFIRDNKLPIPLINEELFFYHLNLYENDYGALTKYKKLLDTINEKYDGDYKAFLTHMTVSKKA